MSPNHLEHDLVLLISTLSHLKNRDQIKSTFLDAINSFWDGVTFEFVPEVNHSETIIPLATAHHTFGGIQPSGTSETLSEPDMALLRNGCRMVALILENRLQAEMLAGEKSHLEAQVDQQAQYLQEVATQLEHEIEGRKVSEQRYRDIFENATVAIFIHDAQNGTILDANQKTLELFGYDSLEALQAHTVGELSAGYPPYSQAEALHHIEQAKLKGVQRFEWLAKHRDGTLFWVEVELKFIVIDGNEWVMAFSREIDSQKKAELALQQSQRRLQSILDTVHMIVVTLDRTGNITYTNDYFLNLTGWSREEVIGQNWFDLVIPSEIRTGLETNVFQKMLESGDFPRHYTNEILTKSGERRMIYWNNTAVYDESLRITGVTSLGQDITLQHTATQQLKGLTTRLSLAVESANIGIWDFNLLTNELIWDDRMFQLYGIEPTTYSKTHEAWQNSVHPQDLDRVEQEVQDAIDTTRRLDTEFRIVHPNGDIRYIRAYAQVLQNDAGEPVRLVGINYDITARKQTEEALWIRNFAIESAITPIGLAHLDGTIFYVNDAFRRLWKYDRVEDIIGRKVNEFTSDLHPIEQLYSMFFEAGGFWVEGYTHAMDGTRIELAVAGTLVTDAKDEPICLMASFVDITERKAAEHALQESEARYRSYIENAPDAIFISDEHGQFVEVNPAACELTGYSKAELLHMHVRDITPVEYQQEAFEHFKTVIGTGRDNAEFPFLKKDGTQGYWYIKAVQVTENRYLAFKQDVTARVLAERALRESEERYRLLVENSPLGIIAIDAEGRTTQVNPALLTILGSPSVEATTAINVLTYPPLVEASFANAFRRGLAGEEITVDKAYHTKWGKPVHLRAHLKPLRRTSDEITGVLAIVEDFTAYRQAELALHESEERNRSLLSAIPDLLFEISAEGIFVDAQTPDPEALLVSKDRLIGKSITEVLNPELAQLTRKHLQHVLATHKLAVYEYHLEMKDGLHYYESRMVPKGVSHVIAIVRDITDRKQAEEALKAFNERLEEMVEWRTEELRESLHREKQLSDELKTALAAEKELNELKSQFVSMVSHEFRTPLAAILSSAELLRDFGPQLSFAKKQSRYDAIVREVHHLNTLLESVIFLGKSELNRLNLNTKPTEMVTFCQQIINEIQPIYPDHYLQLVTIETSLTAEVDPHLMQEVLMNLLTNAVKYSPHQPKVQLFLRQVKQNQHEGVEIKVTDTGIGIPPEALPHIFESFYRAKNTENLPGTGLGLAVVKECVELHHGTISVTSTPGKGSTFILWLPNNQ